MIGRADFSSAEVCTFLPKGIKTWGDLSAIRFLTVRRAKPTQTYVQRAAVPVGADDCTGGAMFLNIAAYTAPAH